MWLTQILRLHYTATSGENTRKFTVSQIVG
jgi:hypothetical protein